MLARQPGIEQLGLRDNQRVTMRIGQFQQVLCKASVLDLYDAEMMRFNLVVLFVTLVVAGVGIALLALW